METAGGSQPPDELGQIATPAAQPPGKPDRKTRKELDASKAPKPTLSDHYRASVEGHRESLDQERLRLLEENTRLCQELDRTLPELATLRERIANLHASTNISVVRVALGGALISGAG